MTQGAALVSAQFSWFSITPVTQQSVLSRSPSPLMAHPEPPINHDRVHTTAWQSDGYSFRWSAPSRHPTSGRAMLEHRAAYVAKILPHWLHSTGQQTSPVSLEPSIPGIPLLQVGPGVHRRGKKRRSMEATEAHTGGTSEREGMPLIAFGKKSRG